MGLSYYCINKKIYIIINTNEGQSNLPFTQWTNQPTELIVLFLPNNPLPNVDPITLPMIEVPSSTFCFFEKGWEKQERMVTPRGSNKRDHQGKRRTTRMHSSGRSSLNIRKRCGQFCSSTAVCNYQF
ncbi:unnamed protein product [Caenorhabditis brenneri]